MKLVNTLAAALLAVCSIVGGNAAAQGTVKIGVIAEFTGPFADYGTQIYNGMKTYIRMNGDTFGGKKVEFVVKDTTGAAPELAKRLSQDAVTLDKVDILAGFGLTPNALASAPVSTEAKKPMVIMNAATSSIVSKAAPYVVRVSHTLPQDTMPMAEWALKNGIKRVFVLVSDYGPGKDAEAQFVKTFTAGGGEIVGSVRTPLANPEFAPFIQRAKDSNPQALFVFLPPGSQTISFIKGYEERGPEAGGHQDHRHRRPHRRRRARGDGRAAPSGSSRRSTTRSRTIRRRTRRSSRRTARRTARSCARTSWRRRATTAWRRSPRRSRRRRARRTPTR